MTNPKGYRRGTRYMFSRDFRKKGYIPLSTYMQVYKVGDIVDIKVGCGAVTKGMPHKSYHGKTGRVFNVTQHALGVIVNKRVRGKVLPKRINIRIEHVKHSQCRKDFLDRVKTNEAKKREAREKGIRVQLKRQKLVLTGPCDMGRTVSKRSPMYKWLFPRILEDVQLAKLSDHKYSSASNSILDPYMNVFWNWLVTKVPLWVAPNLITITGLIINIVTSVVLMYYAPLAKECAPRWAYFCCGMGLFIYQSLDAIDGKQARRTESSSPLGEMFDHGCDSVSTACIACRLGMHPNWLFFQTLTAVTLFYCSHWQTYVSGTLKFGKIDVTEAQVGIMSIHMISSFLGPEIWDLKMPFVGVPLKFGPVAMSCVSAALFYYATFSTIFAGGVGKNGSTVAIPLIGVDFSMSYGILAFSLEFLAGIGYFNTILCGGVGKNGSTVAGRGTSVLSPFLPIAMVVIPGFIISQKSESRIFEHHPCLYLATFGIVAAKITNKLVVAHMTKHEMTFMDSAYIGPAMLFLNQYFDFYIPEVYVLWLALIWSVFDLIKYSAQVCLEICDHMGIFLFKIKPKGDGVEPVVARQSNGMSQRAAAPRTPSGMSVVSSASTNYQTAGGGYSSSSSSSPSPQQPPARRLTRSRVAKT
ncbi:unnamed protein product [Notodromas monacha]|uniref:diacylglycerol cholinephosphotransferase n=1 Tax=Notodromas monacha TaxID=399045 RepID=A0A7R9G9J3_9CRUS|nr:unnamed protein product [Notodromas monacha]CAG0912682.1 unnamed protein product [Notodromas monacha]